ncbi:MAG TPA: LamG domain-containing protein, partial [Candidatus Marinimicrobia bacterium]|nr:LamG domain-containing protein [Candidatus Neomarinimicrobiota bacterium]
MPINEPMLTKNEGAFMKYFSLAIIFTGILFAQDNQVTQHVEVWGTAGDVSTTNENPLTGVHTVTFTAGQPFIGNTNGTQYSADFGIWSVFLKEPDAPIVSATDGAQAHPELIRISWQADKLSPPADFSTAIPAGGSSTTGNWVVTRDGTWRANVSADDPAFDDDQSIFPGILYEYGVRVSNEFGYSNEGLDIGFTIPNGKIAGRVFTPGPTPGAPWTPTGNPVADVEVSLSPVMGKSVQLDGTNDYVSVDENYAGAISSEFTVEFWYNVDPAPENATIVDWGSRLQIYHTSEKIKAEISGYIVQADLANSGNWKHIVATYDGSKLRLYQDGSPVDSISYTNALPIPSSLMFGKKRDNTGYFDGYLDDIRIWQVAQSESDIVRNKDRALFGDESGLVGYWKFDENQSTISFDMTDPRENAQLMSGAAWSDEFAQVKLSAHTDVTGHYEIRGVWYNTSDDNGTIYTVTPYKLNHAIFNPPTSSATLTRNDPVLNDVKFLDESLFTVSGVISYNSTTCPVAGVEILLDSASTRPQTFTSEDGEWSMDLEPDESGQLSVRFGGYFHYDTTIVGENTTIDTSYLNGHTFLLGGIEQGYTIANIDEDIAGVDFTDAKTETLTVKIGGGECFYPIGNVDVTVATTPSCYSIELMEKATGSDNKIEITGLPPLNYVVNITHSNTNISFQSKTISLMNGSKTLDFEYKSPLLISLSDL